MKRRGLDGRFPQKPEPIENPIRGFARAAFSFWTGRQVSILFATFFFCSVVLFPGAYIGLMGLSMRRSPAWEPDEQGTDSIKRVFRRFQLVFIDDSKRMHQEKQKNYSIKLLFEIIGLGHFLRHFHRFS